MITSKQRAQLRGMAAALNTELQIGKSGITENVVRQTEEALAARELVERDDRHDPLVDALHVGDRRGAERVADDRDLRGAEAGRPSVRGRPGR